MVTPLRKTCGGGREIIRGPSPLVSFSMTKSTNSSLLTSESLTPRETCPCSQVSDSTFANFLAGSFVILVCYSSALPEQRAARNLHHGWRGAGSRGIRHKFSCRNPVSYVFTLGCPSPLEHPRLSSNSETLITSQFPRRELGPFLMLSWGRYQPQVTTSFT